MDIRGLRRHAVLLGASSAFDLSGNSVMREPLVRLPPRPHFTAEDGWATVDDSHQPDLPHGQQEEISYVLPTVVFTPRVTVGREGKAKDVEKEVDSGSSRWGRLSTADRFIALLCVAFSVLAAVIAGTQSTNNFGRDETEAASTLQAEVDALKANNSSLLAELETLRTQSGSLQSQVSQLVSSNESLQRRNEGLVSLAASSGDFRQGVAAQPLPEGVNIRNEFTVILDDSGTAIDLDSRTVSTDVNYPQASLVYSNGTLSLVNGARGDLESPDSGTYESCRLADPALTSQSFDLFFGAGGEFFPMCVVTSGQRYAVVGVSSLDTDAASNTGVASVDIVTFDPPK